MFSVFEWPCQNIALSLSTRRWLLAGWDLVESDDPEENANDETDSADDSNAEKANFYEKHDLLAAGLLGYVKESSGRLHKSSNAQLELFL